MLLSTEYPMKLTHRFKGRRQTHQKNFPCSTVSSIRSNSHKLNVPSPFVSTAANNLRTNFAQTGSMPATRGDMDVKPSVASRKSSRPSMLMSKRGQNLPAREGASSIFVLPRRT